MKFLLLFLFLSYSLCGDVLEFSGTYHTDRRSSKAEGRYGTPGGCIYSGLSVGERKIKVYTTESCPVITGPIIGLPDKKLKNTRIKGNFSCTVSDGALFELAVMYEGVCTVK